MSELKGYRCENCGEMLPISKIVNGVCTCDYCGSQYKVEREYGRYKIEHLPFKSVVFRCRKFIDFQTMAAYNPEEVLEVSLREMANEIAEKLMPFMEFDVSSDILTFGYNINSNIRIAVPRESATEALKRFKEPAKVTVEAPRICGLEEERFRP